MYDQLDIDKLSENDIKKNAISISKIKDYIKKTKGEEKKKESQEQQIREGIIEELSRFTGQYAHKLKNYLKPIASNSLSLTEIVKKFKSKIEKNQFKRIIEKIKNIDEALDKTRNTINKFDDAIIVLSEIKICRLRILVILNLWKSLIKTSIGLMMLNT